MKKYISYMITFLCITLVTGCGGKSLKCVKEYDLDGLNIVETHSLKFNKNSVKSIDINIDVNSNEESDDVVDNIFQSINDEFSDYFDNRGVSYSVSEKQNGFLFDIKVNFNKLSKDLKSKVSFINYTNSYELVKNDLEQKDFTCK